MRKFYVSSERGDEFNCHSTGVAEPYILGLRIPPSSPSTVVTIMLYTCIREIPVSNLERVTANLVSEPVFLCQTQM
jgi:hypothetical protein